MFNFLKKKQKSPVEFIDASGYGSAKIQPKQLKIPSNMSVTKDGYVAISAPTSLPYPQSSAYSQSEYPSTNLSDDKTFKILRKLDFLADKLDLMEKKIARIERKTGVSFEDI